MRQTLWFWTGVCALGLGWHAAPLRAQETLPPDEAGICQLPDRGGRTIVDAEGRLVSLHDFCSQLQAQQLAAKPILAEDAAAFWQSFLRVASPEAIAFSQTLDPQAVVSYAATICPFLQDGGSLRDVRQVQRQGELPVTFDVAVTVAAIDAYCPNFRSQLGR